MKTKARRRLLVSSLCMLLVAIVAMGTATFAWFTNTTTATADKAKVTVAAPSGLIIAAVAKGAEAPAQSQFKSSIDISSLAAKTLTPVSGNAGASSITFYEASVDSEKNVSKISDTANYIAVDIYAALSATNQNNEGAEVAKQVMLTSITSTATTPGQVVRCAYYGDATSTAQKVAYMNFGSAERSVYPLKATAASLSGVTTDDSFVIPNTETSYVGSELKAQATPYNPGAKTQIGSAKFTTGESFVPTKIGTVYFWVEGQDVLCNNANIATVVGATNDIKISFELGNDIVNG